jgi:hypothetical protein
MSLSEIFLALKELSSRVNSYIEAIKIGTIIVHNSHRLDGKSLSDIETSIKNEYQSSLSSTAQKLKEATIDENMSENIELISLLKKVYLLEKKLDIIQDDLSN